MTDRASVVGTTPQSRHPGHQMRKFLTKYSAAGTFETVDHFCRTSSRVRCDKQMYVVWHHFHSLDEHAVLLCRGIQNVLEPLFHFTDKNFEAILRAEHDVVRQVEDGSGVLDVTTVFWRLKSYVISLPCSYLFFKYLYALTCRLKSAVRRAVTYRGESTHQHLMRAPPGSSAKHLIVATSESPYPCTPCGRWGFVILRVKDSRAASKARMGA